MEAIRSIKIKEPYWGAWKECGWGKGVWGVGLQKRYLEGKGLVRIISEYHDSNFLMDIDEARKVAKEGKHKPKGMKLYIIPMTILKLEVVDGDKVAGQGQQAKEIPESGARTSREAQGELF